MKQKDKKTELEAESHNSGDCGKEMTIFDQMHPLLSALSQRLRGGTDCPETVSTTALPKWCSKIVERLVRTIFKPIVKLKPDGTMNWRNYGKMIGLFERYKIFIARDVERIFIEAGLDKITDEEWERMKPMLGFEQYRAVLSSALGSPLVDDEAVKNAVEELLRQQLERLEKSRSEALWQVSQQDAITANLFFKGFHEGFSCFLDSQGQYVGDRGRTRLY